MDDAIIVALGSNLSGDYASSQALLEAAVAALDEAGLHVVARSDWWRSAAWPNRNDPPFLNGVCLVQTRAGPADVLSTLHSIEHAFGRDRHQTNAPRTLDLDLIAHGRTVAQSPSLPHPRMHERLFVVGPLAQIAPAWRHPVLGETAADLGRHASVGIDAAPIS